MRWDYHLEDYPHKWVFTCNVFRVNTKFRLKQKYGCFQWEIKRCYNRFQIQFEKKLRNLNFKTGLLSKTWLTFIKVKFSKTRKKLISRSMAPWNYLRASSLSETLSSPILDSGFRIGLKRYKTVEIIANWLVVMSLMSWKSKKGTDSG